MEDVFGFLVKEEIELYVLDPIMKCEAGSKNFKKDFKLALREGMKRMLNCEIKYSDEDVVKMKSAKR